MSAPQNRDGSGRWPKGVSGNPGGRPKGQAELSRTTRELVGEEMGFEVVFDLSSDADEDAVLDAFILEAIEANGLSFGGGLWEIGKYFRGSGFVTVSQSRTRPGAGGWSATGEDRQEVQRWLDVQPQIVGYEVGPLVDAWYPPDDDEERKRPDGRRGLHSTDY